MNSSEKSGLYVKTFGCQMNEYDSEKFFTLLSPNYKPVQAPEDAELILINTCSVREKAEHKLFSLLGRVRDLKKIKPQILLGVTGCVAQQEGKNIISRNSAVDFVVGTHNISLIPSLVESCKSGLKAQVAVDYRDEWEELPKEFHNQNDLSLKDSFGSFYSPVRAMVAIQRGCNKHCTFCVVPSTRGPETSRDIKEILREIRYKVSLGAKEVLLLGQTVNSWGRDLTPRRKFEELIGEVNQIDGLERIRFISPHPSDVTPSFIQLYKNHTKLVPSIHMPLQSGSNRILKLMNRNYKIERYLDIISELKEINPSIAISTDIIVGFPTETEQDFEETLEVINKVGYGLIYSYIYSRRPNTKARSDFSPDQEVPISVTKKRLKIVQELGGRIAFEINNKHVGKEVTVLLEDVVFKESDDSLEGSKNLIKGRSPGNILVDIQSNLNSGEISKDMQKTISPGALVNVKISSATPFGLRGELDL